MTAAIASGIPCGQPSGEDAFVAGLVHNIGLLVLVCECPQSVRDVADLVIAERLSLTESELQIHGVTHAQIGAYLLDMWGLPYPVIEAVAHQHAPWRVEQREFDLLAAVYVADTLAAQARPLAVRGVPLTPPELDLSWVERLGVADKVSAWKRLAAARVKQSAGQR